MTRGRQSDHHLTIIGVTRTNFRTYGKAPFPVAVLHGGPGASGEMAPVARALASNCGVLEPLQTATTLAGQVEELRTVLQENTALPVTLLGYSWGAWLGYLVAAHYPALVNKLILVGSGPYEEKYVAGLEATRLSRLSIEERAEFRSTVRMLGEPTAEGKDGLLARLGALAAKTDAYAPVIDESPEPDKIGVQGDLFQSVWQDAAALRKSGGLLALGKRIRCPVVAIHGDYDPHPAEGVRIPLSATLADFRFILLKDCGHTPWLERQARDEFYRVLKEELPLTVSVDRTRGVC
ncbi:MAG: alpha/beta hydrolase [Anaerolineae bacterium]|nr:alpha/beta hydrolase [Anaerolineae bacterium]